MIRFARYIFIREKYPLDDGAQQKVSKALQDENFIDEAFRPLGKLLTYCQDLGLEAPLLSIQSGQHAVYDPFIDLSRPRHRCPICEKMQPSDGTFVEHPVTGEKFKIEIENCISCGADVNRFWLTTEDDFVFRSHFSLCLKADNFVCALPTIGYAVPEFLDTIAKTCGAPLKEIFIALKVN